MGRISDELAGDPLIAAALAARRIDPRNLPQGDTGRDDECRMHGTRTLPSVLLESDGGAHISWYKPDHVIRYAIDGDTRDGIVTIDKLVMPDAMIGALSGRPLSEVVSFPGAERMRIVEAVNTPSFPGDATDLRMTVEPIAEPPASIRGEPPC